MANNHSQVSVGSRHAVHSFTFANNTLRDAHVYANGSGTTGDSGKIVRVGSAVPYTFYLITGVTAGVATFAEIGSSGAGGGLTINPTIHDANFTIGENLIEFIGCGDLPFTATLPADAPQDTRIGLMFLATGPAGGALTLTETVGSINFGGASVTIQPPAAPVLIVLRWNGSGWQVDTSILEWNMLTTSNETLPGVLARIPDGAGSQELVELAPNANEIFASTDRVGLTAAYGPRPPLEQAKIIATMLHWNSSNAVGTFTAEPNRAYHVQPGGGGIIIDMPNVADTPDGAEILIFKNESSGDGIDVQPGDSAGFVSSGALVANVTWTTSYAFVKFKYSALINRWLVSSSL